MFPSQEAASQVKENKVDTLLAMPNVVGVGVGYKTTKGVTSQEVSVVVLVRRKLPLAALGPEMVLPAQIEGVKVDVKEVGEIRSWRSQHRSLQNHCRDSRQRGA
jgi:hypothetical protein